MTSVRKSYVGAGKFVSAAKMGKKKLQSSTREGMYKPRPYAEQIGVSQQKLKEFIDSGKKNGSRYPGNVANVLNPSGPAKTNLPRTETTVKGRRVNIMRTKNMPEEIRGYAMNYGGKRGVSNVVMNDDGKILRKYGPNVDRGYYRHELGHAAPKRSSWRLSQQIANNPKKLGREEGRVDFNAGFRYKNKPKAGESVYNEIARTPGFLMPKDTREFRSGYIDVQNRLARAQRRNVKKAFGSSIARSVPRLGTGTKPMMAPVRTGVMKPLRPKPLKAGVSPTLTKPKYGG